MKVSFRHLLCCVLLLVPLSLTAQEEPQDKPVATNPEVIDARNHLEIAIDKSVTADAYVDLITTLLADNPLGIDVSQPDAALRAQLDLGEDEGLIVTNIPPESVGAKAGLKVHDVIVGLDATKVGDIGKLADWLGATEGKTVTLKVRRGGRSIELAAETTKPQYAKLRWAMLDRDLAVAVDAERYRIGVTLSEADETLRTQLRLASGEGLVVTEVLSSTPAESAGIRVHDVLTMLDGKRLTTVEAINAQIQEIQDRAVEVRLLRGGKETTAQITPRKSAEPTHTFQDVKLWDTTNCKSCHKDSHGLDPHRLMGEKLGAKWSVWTDGDLAKIHNYEKAYRAQVQWADLASKFAGQPAANTPQQQIDALRSQLVEMQKTLANLEATLQQPRAESIEEGKVEKKD